jgi:transcriptional regulator of acetoin/glycerol metabolism
LRVIQEQTVTAIGEVRPRSVDVKFIAAAQTPLGQAVAAGRFRPDLQGRLESFVFQLPPLRKRTEDIGVIVAHCLRSSGVTEQDSPRISPDAALRLLLHDWPLNIRELAQAVQRAWASSKNGLIEGNDLPDFAAPARSGPADLKVELVAQLRSTHGNVAEVARRMGRARPLVHRWLKRLGIDPESFRR